MKLEKVHGRSFLVYYKNKGEEKHSGQILLEEASIELDENNNKNWRVVTSKRKFYLKSSNEEVKSNTSLMPFVRIGTTSGATRMVSRTSGALLRFSK